MLGPGQRSEPFNMRPETKSKLCDLLNAAISLPETQIPGLVAAVVNRSGDILFSHASGIRNVDNKDVPMTTDTIFWIASCTKLVTAVACMQLVEQGKLALDDADIVSKLCPELIDLTLLGGEDTVKLKGNTITARMLLSHTAGFGYTAFDAELRASVPIGHNELSGLLEDIRLPLLFEPGSDWNYGVSIDWLGVLIERISGMRLNDYFQEFIFRPLDMKDITAFPNTSLQTRLSTLHRRDLHSGKVISGEHVLTKPLASTDTLCFGGTGLFGSPEQYIKLLGVLLNDGVSQKTNARILLPETVEEMFINQIPHFPDFASKGIKGGIPHVMNKIDKVSMPGQDGKSGWGFAGMLQEVSPENKPKRVTAWWCGLSNLYWWCDREEGVAGIVGTQILPFWDPQVLKVWQEMFTLVYQS